MPAIPSLGDSSAQMQKVQETFPLPGNRKELVIAFERILNLGGVQKVVVDRTAPIKVTRLVMAPPSAGEVPEELQDDDIVSAARNVEMEEFSFIENLSPFEYLYHAFHTLSLRKLKARTMVVASITALQKWLKANYVSEVYGIEVREHKEIPEGVLLLVATGADDPETIVFSLKLEMTERKA